MNLLVNPVITDFQQDVDGTIKKLKLGENKEDAYANIIEQGSSDLENNKAATINVSTYTQPVEVTPTSGKDGMKKATITLSNIPSPSPATSVTFYAWESESNALFYTLSATPSVGDNVFIKAHDEDGVVMTDPLISVESVSEGTIVIIESESETLTRASSNDIVFNKAES